MLTFSFPTWQHSRSWISEDDIYKPRLADVPDQSEAPPRAPSAELKVSQSPPSVVHRRQIGNLPTACSFSQVNLSVSTTEDVWGVLVTEICLPGLANPFRGLLKLGHLERRSAVGLWRDFYCELSPFEFRLYLDAEERTCCDNCSLLRCEGARITSPEGRFDLVFPGKRLSLRAANRDEAEDWIDRIVEAINKCRPAFRADDQWEVLQPAGENGADPSAPVSASCGPEQNSPSVPGTCGGQEKPPPLEFRWTRSAGVEADAIKEAVLYVSSDPEARTWVPLVFSLSLEALKGFQVKEGRKLLRQTHPVEEIRDVVPEVSLGGPQFFKLLTIRETLRLRAENAEEARSWRALIREALDSYLESGEEGVSVTGIRRSVSGNLQRLVQHRLKEDGALFVHLCRVPSEMGLDAQNFKCAGQHFPDDLVTGPRSRSCVNRRAVKSVVASLFLFSSSITFTRGWLNVRQAGRDKVTSLLQRLRAVSCISGSFPVSEEMTRCNE